MDYASQQWVKQEFGALSLGDKRLNERGRTIINDLFRYSQHTLASTLSHNKPKLKGAYRFFRNEKVTTENLLAPHVEQTLERIRQNESGQTILMIQDTVVINFTKRTQTPDLDVIHRSCDGSNHHGLMLHNTMAINLSGQAQGLLWQGYIDRKETAADKIEEEKKPSEERESRRWSEAMKACQAMDVGDARMVHVADREADIEALFHEAREHDAQVLIRASHNRVLEEQTGSTDVSGRWLFDKLGKMQAQGTMTVKVQCNKRSNKYRKARLSIIHAPITLPAHKQDGKEVPSLTLTAIMAVERNYSPLADAICWVLLTNLPIDDVDSAIEKVEWYTLRWNIEVFHKVLKSGCQVKKAQLRTADRLKKYITMNTMIAWRLFWMSRLEEDHPEYSCAVVLEEPEWQLLYRKIHKGKRPPKKPPTLKEAKLWIAKLGGYLDRPSDPPPGVISLWRGWERLNQMVDDYMDICGSS